MEAATQSDSTFACEGCQKRYRWSTGLAGRKVRCKCGVVLQCPLDPAPAGDPMYDVAPAAPDFPQHAIAVHPSTDAGPAGEPPLGYRAPRDDHGDALEKYFPDKVKDFYMPLWLIGGATAIQLLGAAFWNRGTGGVALAMTAIGMQMVVGTVVMLCGILIAVRFRGISLGPFPTALLKLAAVSVAPGALMTILLPLAFIIPFRVGSLLIWGAGFVLYFALLGALFDLDESDTWYCIGVIFVLRVGLYFAFLLW
jgi:hypothetical protein